MFVKKLFTYLTRAYLKSKRCFNVKYSIYYFYMKTKILADFQICISVSLKKVSRSSPAEVFLGKGVLKICSKFTWEHPCRSVISIKLQSNFIEITLRHGCSLVNLIHIFRTTFYKNTFGRLILDIQSWGYFCTAISHLQKLVNDFSVCQVYVFWKLCLT